MIFPAPVVDAIRVHAANEHPNESCGLIAGSSGLITFFYPLTNVDSSPTTYTLEPAGHIGALRHAERNGWQLVGVVHSHPSGPAVPSRTDIVNANEPSWLHVIAGVDGLRAWSIDRGEIREISMSVDP